jgi:hypothetical protein
MCKVDLKKDEESVFSCENAIINIVFGI